MINLVTETSQTYGIEILEQNAVRLVLEALKDFDPDCDQISLLFNVYQTLSKQLKE